MVYNLQGDVYLACRTGGLAAQGAKLDTRARSAATSAKRESNYLLSFHAEETIDACTQAEWYKDG